MSPFGATHMWRAPRSVSVQMEAQNPLGTVMPASFAHFAAPPPCAASGALVTAAIAARTTAVVSRRMFGPGRTSVFARDNAQVNSNSLVTTASARHHLLGVRQQVRHGGHRRDAPIEVAAVDHRHHVARRMVIPEVLRVV